MRKLSCPGWDTPAGVWHYFDGGEPICGSDVPPSRVMDRVEQLPSVSKAGKVCKRCRKARAN